MSQNNTNGIRILLYVEKSVTQAITVNKPPFTQKKLWIQSAATGLYSCQVFHSAKLRCSFSLQLTGWKTRWSNSNGYMTTWMQSADVTTKIGCESLMAIGCDRTFLCNQTQEESITNSSNVIELELHRHNLTWMFLMQMDLIQETLMQLDMVRDQLQH